MRSEFRAPLAREPGCAAQARGLIAACLEGVVDETTLGDAKLIASELVSNAYLHGRGSIELVVHAHADRMRIEVIDEGEGASIEVSRHLVEGNIGRGLQIVDALASAWGADDGATHVWAELPAA